MDAEASFRKLLEPLQIKRVRFRNRMVKPAQVLGFAAEDGNASPMLIDFYETLAKGGVGMIVVESTCVDYPIGGKGENRLRIDEDRFIPSFARLAETIHGHGCPTFLQLTHNGPAAHFSGLQPLAASALSREEMPVADPRVEYDLAQAMTLTDIERCVEKFAEAARRARQAGFDGAEFHGGHSYLINSFLSRAWNRRDDDYGCQTLENRARFGVEIICQARARVGEDFVLGMRVNGQEWGHERGITSEESQAFARIFEAAGLDYINVTGWGYGTGAYSWVQYPEQLLYPEPTVALAKQQLKMPGVITVRAAAIKKVVSIPVFTVGRLDPHQGEWILRNGLADAIALGRRLMADPELPRKVAEGRPEDIRPCMGCLECRTKFGKYRPTSCRVNAALGREREYEIKPAPRKKKVAVVGGGPAGLEAARVLAARGHAVTLYEREPQLGGSLPLAAMIKGTEIEDLPALVRYFETQLRKLGVRLELGREFTPELLETLKPDAVVVAVGGLPATPALRGIEGPNVLSGEKLKGLVAPFLRLLGPRLMNRLTRLWLPVGRDVVIIGGLLHGCQVASFLVKRGRKVTVAESSEELGEGTPVALKPRLLDWLAEKGATLLSGVEYLEITKEGLTVKMGDGSTRVLRANTVITALPLAPNLGLSKALEGKVAELYSVGDCIKPQQILQAIEDGSRVGHAI